MDTHPNLSAAPTVHSLNCFVLSVPNLDEACRFYESFGLRVLRRAGRLELYTEGHPHRWAMIYPTQRNAKRLEYLSFGCYQTDIEPLGEHFRRKGFVSCAPHPLASSEGLWISHPDGFPVQVVAAEKSIPACTLTPSILPPPAARSRVAPSRSIVREVRPSRLSHLLLFSPDVSRAITFCQDALGLRLSDRSGDGIAFLHAAHGSDHHLIAVAKSEGPGLHHCSWEVGSLDEVGLGMEQMRTAGYTQGWGVGRHVLGSNYFYYVRDPWGSYSEYSFDIDYIPQGCQWSAADHPPDDSFYLWGPPVPADFVRNYELAGDAPCA